MPQKKYLKALNKIVVTLTVLTMAYSCSLIPKKVDVISKPVERQIAQPILPRSIDLKNPFWYVVSEKNLDSFIETVKREEGRVVFVAMSIPDYELMAYNMQELKRYIRELKEVVVYYRMVTSGDKNEQ